MLNHQPSVLKNHAPPQLSNLTMHGVISRVLDDQRPAFSRTSTQMWFGTGVYSLLFNNHIDGIQSMVNSLDLCDGSYSSLDRMYRSDGINLPVLREKWVDTVLNLTQPVRYGGMALLVSDGVKNPKEGRKMPGVTRLHNNSETQSKPSSYFGIQGGAIGILAKGGPGCSNSNEVYNIPLSMELMYGLDPIKDWPGTPHPDADQPLEMQMLNRQKDYLKKVGDSIFIEDRASMNQNLFAELESWRADGVKAHLLTNAKGNVTAYYPPGEYSGSGRPRIRGDKVHLSEWFESRKEEFKTCKMWLYGKKQKVRYLQEDLLWGCKWNGMLCFVLAVLEDGRRIILATDNLKAGPKSIIKMYSWRFLCEEGFKVYKNDFAGMRYHFWTKTMEHLSHFRKADEPHILESVETDWERKKVLAAIKAAEVYMQGACIAQGIAQLISMNQLVGGEVQRYTRKRTYTHRKVSERDVCCYLEGHKELYYQQYADDPQVQFIRARQREGVLLASSIL